MSVSYRVITPKELDSTLQDAWRTIQSMGNAYASPYFCPEFTSLVGSVRRDVRVVVIENAGRPVGFFPHQRSLLGMGRPVGGPLSDYHGVIAEPGSEWTVGDLMRAAKLAVWTFDHLVDESRRFDPHVTAHATSPQIDLSAGFGQYMRELRDPPQDFARKARKLAREFGDLTFTLHDSDSSAMDYLIKWKSEQYHRTRLMNAFSVRWTGELLRRIVNTHTAEFSGVCSVLRSGDRVVAVHAGMRSRQICHWWFPTYDHNLARYSPGIIMLLRMAEQLAANGIYRIDLGKGDEQYKRSLMTGGVELREGCVELPSLLANVRQLRRAMRRAQRGAEWERHYDCHLGQFGGLHGLEGFGDRIQRRHKAFCRSSRSGPRQCQVHQGASRWLLIDALEDREMSLPNLSYMTNVGQLRFIQSHYEAPDYRNPDTAVGSFLSIPQRVACAIRGRLLMSRLRASPFYHYILARTRHYDKLFLDAIHDSFTCIINIGCGSDTRAYRFARILNQNRVTVLECDQPQAIRAKQKIAQKYWSTGHVRYVPLDLNETGWTDFSQLLNEWIRAPALVMMEGVSPYIRSSSFEAFLRLLAANLHPHSSLAYDFKIAGVMDDFGRSETVRQPFRLPAELKDVATYHKTLGFKLQQMELSTELLRRLLPGAPLLFDEDGLLRLRPCGRFSPKVPSQVFAAP